MTIDYAFSVNDTTTVNDIKQQLLELQLLGHSSSDGDLYHMDNQIIENDIDGFRLVPMTYIVDKYLSKKKDSKKKDSKKKDSKKKDSNKKDSNKKESKKKESNKKDSNKKDSNKKDSNKKDSKKIDSNKKDSKKIDSNKKDSNKKESKKKDSDSNKKDSNEKDSNKKDSKSSIEKKYGKYMKARKNNPAGYEGMFRAVVYEKVELEKYLDYNYSSEYEYWIEIINDKLEDHLYDNYFQEDKRYTFDFGFNDSGKDGSIYFHTKDMIYLPVPMEFELYGKKYLMTWKNEIILDENLIEVEPI